MADKVLVGVDVGGTTIAAGCLVNNMLMKKAKADTGAERSSEEILQTLIHTIRRVWRDDVDAIGLGVPGFLDVERGVILTINNIPSFKGLNLKDSLEKEFGCRVYINNDANCFVLGEAYFGAGSKYENVVGMTIGTGLGAGIVLNNHLHSGLGSGAGEFGCMLYKDGTFEDYISSKFFKKYYDTTGYQLFVRAENGDVSARLAFEEFGYHLGNLINTILYFIAPESIVIGGSIAGAYKYFESSMYNVVNTFLLPDISKKVKIVRAELDNAAIMGAAGLYYNAQKEVKIEKTVNV